MAKEGPGRDSRVNEGEILFKVLKKKLNIFYKI